MKYLFSNILKQLEKYKSQSVRIDHLTEFNWVSISEIKYEKRVFLFKPPNSLLIVANGKVEWQGQWELIGSENILITYNSSTFLLKHAFVDDYILVLRRDGSSEYAIFINETRFGSELNCLSEVERFIKDQYGEKIRGNYESQIFNEIRQNNPNLSIAEIYTMLDSRLRAEGWR